MQRRQFLFKASALTLGGISTNAVLTPVTIAHDLAPSSATGSPIRIVMGGYGPPTTSFSQALKKTGDRLESRFPAEVEVKYVYNVLEVGYTTGDLRWLVGDGVFALGYLTMTGDVPELELAALPFLFPDTDTARAAMDGAFGQKIAAGIEAGSNYRVLGFFENEFRHISNSVRPVTVPADLVGLNIRTLGSGSLIRTFELLGATPRPMPLTMALEQIREGTLDGQENPFANAVTYNIYPYQQYHTMTNHTYLSRPIFVHRPSFDTWPSEVQEEMRNVVREAITFQRELRDLEELEAAETIREAGGEIVELSAAQRAEFVSAVAPIYEEARKKFSREQLDIVGL
jgi:TRAP-type C4-dicarboxylate transport system substrate-binding protein